MESLDDKNLERLGIIKEIDTLDIIRKSNEIREKKKKTGMIVFLSVITIVSMIAQVMIIEVFGVNTLQLIAMTIYVVVLCIVLVLFCIKGGDLA